ncbi:uncharacterized protein BYT42DRAFT_131942 [Radiomyces spectabilis]|uniref:uncharacterized protein n=1 Tax=Radiomyces spectabilis TaxID=64574 RepID=UPI00221E9AF0|nr:uncharacterized protein BYT42DRAFT_131942 [Radiomyces spectabilis]KAI8367582.1 hypothetical protein BYT42DRAFT_131942 [Radiomyces spectabilis]
MRLSSLFLLAIYFQTTVTQNATDPSTLPGGIARIRLENSMTMSFIFTQFNDHLSYTIFLDPNLTAYWMNGVCLSWVVGLPPLLNNTTQQCAFKNSQQCLSSIPLNPCQNGGFKTDRCNTVETLSGSISLSDSRLTVLTPLVTVNSTNMALNPGNVNTIAGRTVMIAYTQYENDTNSPLRQQTYCSMVQLGNGTIANFTLSETNAATLSSSFTGSWGILFSGFVFLLFLLLQ